jgi:hypothetical protein
LIAHSFEEWVSSQPNQVRRDLYEHVWVKELCRDAWNASRAAAEYDQGYRDAHPGAPDCETCGGRGEVSDELTFITSPCHCMDKDVK